MTMTKIAVINMEYELAESVEEVKGFMQKELPDWVVLRQEDVLNRLIELGIKKFKED